ncbi:MAG TPA: alanine dehydrogenase [Firmicutes bacterium]|uniref:Alanine dehydrogenase n=1 Tax=Candidatus Fermentithermobacillus carboniphilus TaxID=3085328 RepID=A0AAT9LCU1_9FIRM|nr:MAG: alanine dehydrogenase [Candidatus Fermentithermobacillus carboniphilus]HHW17950.1 alanine dehydrogenase [Candidatus Fermentithermobacillaceae bacterium]
MKIGVPKEIKPDENRVSLTPAGAKVLASAGHQVFIEKGAGLGSGFGDDAYVASGAKILPDAASVWSEADMIIKVKEPLPPEYPLMKKGQIIFTYLHLAPEPELTRALMEKGVHAIAYETVELPNKSLPLLTPMSEIAGRMSIQIGAHFLEKRYGGQGVLLGGVPGVPPAHVVIIGGGTVGTNAAKIAQGMGARVTILDVNLDRLRYLDDIFGSRVQTLASNEYNIAEAVKKADLLVGSVLVPGAKAPKLVKEEMVKAMKPGSVIVDVAIDQGGCIETMDHTTTHSNPTFMKHGVVHYSVPNIPGAVPRTSTLALTNATLPYAVLLAEKGFEGAVRSNPALAKGVNVTSGKITYKAVAVAHNLPYTPLEEVLK